MRIDVLGVGFDDLTPEEAIDRGAALMEDGCHYAVTPNPEFLLHAKKDPAFRAILNRADLVLADGVGVVKAASILGHPLRGKVTGIDFAAGLMKRMAQSGKRLFLLGAKPGVAEMAEVNLRKRYPGLMICGTHDGYFSDGDAMAREVHSAHADVVFVCLGAPKQERWMVKYGAATGAHLLAGLGGSLDVFAGVAQRAPETWQRLNMEWLYRLLKDPKRIGRMAKLPLVLVDAAAIRVGRKSK